jgi:hypothetical protein
MKKTPNAKDEDDVKEIGRGHQPLIKDRSVVTRVKEVL